MSDSRLTRLYGLDRLKVVAGRLASPGNHTHAVLLYGGEGSGKTTIARSISQAWLCQQPVNGESCGECKPCQSFTKGLNADFLLVEPQPPAHLIRLNQIVEVQRSNEGPHVPICVFLRTPPLQSRHKVILVENADRMNNDASNALLKTLEEPSEFVRIILTTTQISRLLPTIRSRCMALTCPYPETAEVPSEISRDQLMLADGSIGELEKIQTSPELFERLRTFADGLSQRQLQESLVVADEFRSICECFAEQADISARRAQTEALKVLARYIMKVRSDRPEWTQAIIETHRRIQGNANVLPAFDSLFTRLLANR